MLGCNDLGICNAALNWINIFQFILLQIFNSAVALELHALSSR